MDNFNNTAVTTETEAPKKNYIFFNPKKWQSHPDVDGGKSDRFFINGVFDDTLTEVYSLGAWGWEWSEITNGMMTLEKNTEYHFVFWLNGGENDNGNEICQLHIMFGDNSLRIDKSDWDNKLVYKLNRSYIKPLRRYKGWELYDIPFVTSDKEYTQLRFVAQRAPMTVMTAEEPEKYTELPEIIDEFAESRPQRHNIVFEDGWPTNTWYATSRLKSGKNAAPDNKSGSVSGSVHNNFYNIDGVEMDDLVQNIADSIDTSYLANQIADYINIDEIKEEIIERFKESFGG